jgi:hypothetical protein
LEYEGSLSCWQQSARPFVFRCCVIGIPPNSQNCRPPLGGCPYLQVFSSIRSLKNRHDVVARSPTVRDWAVHLRKKFKNTLSLLITHELTVLHDHWILTPAFVHVFSLYHTMSIRSSSINKVVPVAHYVHFPNVWGHKAESRTVTLLFVIIKFATFAQ